MAAKLTTIQQIRREIKNFKTARAFGAVGALLALIGVVITTSSGMDTALLAFVGVLLVFVIVFCYSGGKIGNLRRQASELHRRGRTAR